MPFPVGLVDFPLLFAGEAFSEGGIVVGLYLTEGGWLGGLVGCGLVVQVVVADHFDLVVCYFTFKTLRWAWSVIFGFWEEENGAEDGESENSSVEMPEIDDANGCSHWARDDRSNLSQESDRSGSWMVISVGPTIRDPK